MERREVMRWTWRGGDKRKKVAIRELGRDKKKGERRKRGCDWNSCRRDIERSEAYSPPFSLTMKCLILSGPLQMDIGINIRTRVMRLWDVIITAHLTDKEKQSGRVSLSRKRNVPTGWYCSLISASWRVIFPWYQLSNRKILDITTRYRGGGVGGREREREGKNAYLKT